MKLCRYDDNRLGLIDGDAVADVSDALGVLPSVRWPVPAGDLLIANLDAVRAEVEKLAGAAPRTPLAAVELLSPVANPTKIIGAPVNYQAHVDEAKEDDTLAHGREILGIEREGPFLKAVSSLVGPSEGVAVRFADKRNDHEGELGVVIGKAADRVAAANAMDHVAGYCLALDMSVRGTEDRSARKSCDSYAVLGPWLVTADEIADPGNLDLKVWVNDELRQDSNTSELIYGIPRLIEFFSSFYTLLPGDVIMSGTPEGVGPVVDGDTIIVEIEMIGRMEVPVRNG